MVIRGRNLLFYWSQFQTLDVAANIALQMGHQVRLNCMKIRENILFRMVMVIPSLISIYFGVLTWPVLMFNYKLDH